MSKELQHTSLLDILPQNLLRDEQIKAAAQALDAELQKITAATKEALLLPRLDELPEAVIDLLAWQWHVDFYDDLKTLQGKRNAICKSIELHRIKGTRLAVEMALRMIYSSGIIQEWFEYDGKPYHFRVQHTNPDTVSHEEIERLLRVIYAVKNVRSVLEDIGFDRHVKIGLHYGVAISTNKAYRITLPSAKDTVVCGGTYHGSGVSVYKEVVLHE